MNKVSVIMPVFNTEEFVSDSIKSVLNQTHTDMELVLINDNSNEECTQLLEEISKGDSRVKLFHFKKRQGVGAARNFGIQKATGEFLFFLDSDDYLPPTTLKILADNIKQSDMIRGRIKTTTFSSAMAVILEGLFNVKVYTDNKYKLIKNNSALNFLFRKDFVKNNGLAFSEKVNVYSDLFFVIPAFINAGHVSYVKEALYFKRKRNDPISNPSLTQYDRDKKIEDFLFSYTSLKQMYNDQLAQAYLDHQFLNFYRKTIIIHFKDESQIEILYPSLVKAIKKIASNVVNEYDWILKREIRVLKNKVLKKYKKVIKRHSFLRELKKSLKSKRKFYIFLHQYFFAKMKTKENVVFFESFLAKSYSDSPKYIYEYMVNNNMNFKYVWSVREYKNNIPGKPVQVKRFSLRYFYYTARAKYWVNNIRLPKYIMKPEGNIYLQTWHGTPLKTLVFDQDDIHSADPNHKKNFFEQSRRWDYLSSPNQYSSDIFRRAFKYEKPLLEYGYPRNDILYQKNDDQQINKLKQQMGLPLDKKVILYAPTWRDDEFYSRGNYKFTLQLNLDKMQRAFDKDYILILRTHYHVATKIDVSQNEGFVYNFSDYDDVAELYLVSDILITDYSSVFFDYAHLKRPILFYTYDLEKYRDTLRGFYFDMEEEVPGPLLMTTNEVVQAITEIDQVEINYKNKYNDFFNKFCLWDDGHASEKTVQTVFKNQ